MKMESHGRRLAGTLAAAALIVAGLALPATGQAAKPTTSLEFEVPDEGRVGFNHLVFKTKKKGKVLSRKAAKRTKKGSKKLSKKVRAKVKLKGGQGIPDDVEVVASVARIKGEKRLYALDVAVLHAGPGAQPLSSSDQRTAGVAGGGGSADPLLILGSILSGDGLNLRLHGLSKDGAITYRLQDPDVTGDDPDRPDACAPDGDLARSAGLQDYFLNGARLDNDKGGPSDALGLGGQLFCDQQTDGQYDYLFDLLGLEKPASDAFTCTGVKATPSPTNPTFGHRFTGGTCNQNIAVLDFDCLDCTYYDFQNVPLPSCQFANGNTRVHCTNPNDANKKTIVGAEFGHMPAGDHCARVTARNKAGEQFQTVVPTMPPATCP